jgi:hypothetical protein
MLSLTEIEKAVDQLTVDEKLELHRYLQARLRNGTPAESVVRSHSVLDIKPVQLGSVLSDPGSNDDLLGEMLEGRQ